MVDLSNTLNGAASTRMSFTTGIRLLALKKETRNGISSMYKRYFHSEHLHLKTYLTLILKLTQIRSLSATGPHLIKMTATGTIQDQAGQVL
jgi:hypothetical protein